MTADAPPSDDVRMFMIDAWDGNTRNMTAFLDKYPAAVEVTRGEPIGWTALMWSAQSGNTDAISLLLDRGARIDARDMNGQTPLMLAAHRGNDAAMKIFIARGADVTLEDHAGRSAADLARKEGKDDAAALVDDAVAAREKAAADAARAERDRLNLSAEALQGKMRQNAQSGKFRVSGGRRP